MLAIAVCDDDLGIQDQLKKCLPGIGKDCSQKINIDFFSDGAYLVATVSSGQRYDIIFMDVEMPGINGIDAAIKIRGLDKLVQFIYITSHDHYIYEAVQVAPVGYLIKPLNESKIRNSFKNAVDYLFARDEYYRFSYKNDSYILLLDDIFYFQNNKRLIEIISVQGNYKQYGTIIDIEKEIEKTRKEFVRIHHSYLVNVKWISGFTYKLVTMINGTQLNVSRKYRERLADVYAPLKGE